METEDLTTEELKQLLVYYKNKYHEVEYALLISQLQINRIKGAITQKEE